MREILDYMMVPFNCQLVRILYQLNNKFPGTLLTHNFRLSSGHVYERSLDMVTEVGSIISYARILDCIKRKTLISSIQHLLLPIDDVTNCLKILLP